jgi:hypothetical protein
VSRRFSRPLLSILVAAQILFGAPVVNAQGEAAAVAAEQAGDSHCAGTMTDASEGQPCPCCPDQDSHASSCFGTCLTTPGTAHTVTIAPARQVFALPTARPWAHLAALAEPPLKPPPIV